MVSGKRGFDMYCKCEFKEPMKYYIISADNADEILDVIGFGKNKCKQTYKEDKRYGRVEYDHIAFGFEGKISTRYFFGRYIVFDPNYPPYTWRYLTEQEFLEDYKIVEETND